MPEKRDPGLRTPKIRSLLTLDLPGIPPKMAAEDDTYMLAILASVWLDTDDRLAAAREALSRPMLSKADRAYADLLDDAEERCRAFYHDLTDLAADLEPPEPGRDRQPRRYRLSPGHVWDLCWRDGGAARDPSVPDRDQPRSCTGRTLSEATTSMSTQTPEDQQRCQLVGAILNKRRQTRGYSLAELARAAHVDPSQLRRIENGEGLGSRATLCSLAVALDFQPGEIDRLLYMAQYAPIMDWQAAFMRLVNKIPQALTDCLAEALAEEEVARYDRAHAERNARLGET